MSVLLISRVWGGPLSNSQATVFTAEPNDMNFIPRTHMTEAETSLQKAVSAAPTHTLNKINVIKKKSRTGTVAQLAEGLLCMHKTLDLI